jgi:hypothetical protein
MPAAVACPVCGGDGTAAANEVIARSIPVQVAVAAEPNGAVRLQTAAPALAIHPAAPAAPGPEVARRAVPTQAPQIDRTQAEHEARAKISWGDAPEEVVKFLMIQGLGYEEASAMVHAMFKERAKTIRRNGIKKIILGALLICVPIVALFIFLSMLIFPIKLFAVTIMVGLYGAWMALKGTIMVVAPKSEPGDVATQ